MCYRPRPSAKRPRGGRLLGVCIRASIDTDRLAIVQAALSVHAGRFLNVSPARLPGERDGLDALPEDHDECRLP